MNSEIEDYSDELKRETDEEIRSQLGKTTVAFFDIDNMGIVGQMTVLALIASCFAAIGYFFYKELAGG